MHISMLSAGLLFMLSGWVHAQSTTLDRAEARIAQGAFADARQLLQRWQREHPGAARTAPEQQARYHALSARMITRADSAQDHYLTIALNFPTTKVAPEALLRLAQLHTLRSDSAQAITYLQRLLNDYPDSDLRPTAMAWLARVQPAKASPPAKPNTHTAPPEAQQITIQVGAFREVSGARSVKLQLERAGFSDVRLVRVPDNALIRVRIGRYPNRAAAASVIARLQQQKFTAVIVTDVARESSVR